MRLAHGVQIAELTRISHNTGEMDDKVPLPACPAVHGKNFGKTLLDKPAVAPCGEKCGLMVPCASNQDIRGIHTKPDPIPWYLLFALRERINSRQCPE